MIDQAGESFQFAFSHIQRHVSTFAIKTWKVGAAGSPLEDNRDGQGF